jgi:hypothetical protein
VILPLALDVDRGARRGGGGQGLIGHGVGEGQGQGAGGWALGFQHDGPGAAGACWRVEGAERWADAGEGLGFELKDAWIMQRKSND